MQPDLGTAMVLVPVAIVGAFLAGIEWKHMAVGLVLVALLIPVGWNMRHHLKPYQQQRIETFLHPEENPRSAGYQVLQSEIAVGSGGFWGKGFGKGSQNQLGFVPVRYSDFILAALAEEQGFIGVCVVLLLYLGLILRLVDNAQKAKDRADRLHAGYRNPLAADELRRVGNGICLFGFGSGDERPHASFRQLNPQRLDTKN